MRVEAGAPADPRLDEILAEVRRIDVQARRLVTGVMAGGYLSVFRGAGIEFASVREYEEGDDPRAVDWNVTARVGRPFVKTYVDERELTMMFVLDLSASMRAGLGAYTARQLAARVCAFLGLSAARHGDRVGLVAGAHGVDGFVAPRKGRAHALRIVRDCLALAPGGAGTDLGPLLRFTTSAVRKHAIVFVLSDFLDSGWEQPLRICARRHDVVAVRIMPAELELPRAALLRVRDPESGAVRLVDSTSARVRAAYAARVAAWDTATTRALRKAGVDRLDIPVPRVRGGADLARPILGFFRMRELRGAKR
ncbi:MAG: DUF58 domain-containing protein [Planctomycetota bacterium]|nr:DUF58 domain-containing protein [Planctomycetota bacterium]